MTDYYRLILTDSVEEFSKKLEDNPSDLTYFNFQLDNEKIKSIFIYSAVKILTLLIDKYSIVIPNDIGINIVHMQYNFSKEIIEFLVDNGMSLELRTKYNDTVISGLFALACQDNSMDTIKYLINLNIDIDMHQGFINALKYVDIIQYLFQYEIKQNTLDNALLILIGKKKWNLIPTLIDAGANPKNIAMIIQNSNLMYIYPSDVFKSLAEKADQDVLLKLLF